jgi:hypothetical protein
VNLGQQQPVRARHGFGVQLRAADDEDLVAAAAQRDRRVETVHDLRAGCGEVAVARHDDAAPPRQRPPDRLPRLAPHHDRVAHRRAFEEREVFRQPPRQAAAGADHAVAGTRDDQREAGSRRRVHTATGALMCGCGS